MSGIFGGGEAQKGQNAARRDMKKITKKATKGLSDSDLSKLVDPLRAEQSRLANNGLSPVSFAGPGYGIGIDSTGNINMSRTGETQGWMDRILGGYNTDEQAYGELLSQIEPGFGRLTNARKDELRRMQEKAVGNLRDNLARRRIAGSSFGEQLVGSLQSEYAALTDKAIAESMVEELKMTSDVIGARTQARTQTIAQALDHIQFETNVGNQLLQTTQAALQQNSMAQVELSKSIAEIQLQGRLGRGQITAGVGNTFLGQAADFANIASQEAAGPGQLFGQIGGTVLGAVLGGPAGASIGGSLFGGGGNGSTTLPWNNYNTATGWA